MAPYRNSRTGNRTTRTQIDHDVFEGLPVRHWRKRPISVNAAPEKENIDSADLRNLAWKELAMPRDSHLLSPMSQDLLRAARMPQAKKLAVPLLEDDKDPGEDEDADGDVDTGFVAKRWAVLPKELEGPEPEFLAKRRKGLPSVHSGALGSTSNTGQMRKTKIRKTDLEGNNSVWDVLVPEGQIVEGEVVEPETSPTQVSAPGTVVEGVGVVNAEGVVIAGDQSLPTINRRRPPPPKRKAKGPGRGRKKKVAFVGANGAPTANGADGSLHGAIKNEEVNSIRAGGGAQAGDTEVGDELLMKEGDQEGDEGSEEGSEDEEGEECDREEGELSPSPSVSTPPAKHETPALVETSNQPAPTFPSTTHSPKTLSLPEVAESATNGFNGPLTEDLDKPIREHSHSNRDEPMEEMLDDPMDEMLDEPTDEMLNDSTNEAMPPTSDSILETTHLPTDTGLTRAMLETVTEIETVPPWDVPVVTRGGDVAEETELTADEVPEAMAVTMVEPEMGPTRETVTDSPAGTSAEPLIDTLLNPATPPTLEALVERKVVPRMANQAEIGLEAATDTTIESIGNLPYIPEPTGEAGVDPVGVTSTEPMAKAEDEARIEATAKPVSEAEPDAIVDSPAMAITAPSPGLIVEPLAESVGGSIAEPIAEPVAETVVEPTAEPIDEPIAEPIAEPIVEPVTENHPGDTPPAEHESVVEQVNQSMPESVPMQGRKFSYTRPTSSPKAPTPSPPTPIETTFSGLQAPPTYLSPKAPTMSPPTPIDRGMSSSPDIPLSSFQLPPQLDAAHEAGLASAPDMSALPDALHVSVEAAPQVEMQMNSQKPFAHAALDGTAEPMLVERFSNQSASGNKPTDFDDGEEDMLGSLERSLGS